MSHALATVRRDGRRPSASALGNGPRAAEVPGILSHEPKFKTEAAEWPIAHSHFGR
jgi:hypothetical protein